MTGKVRVAGLVLAAGLGTRMAGGSKLLREVGGSALVRRAAKALREGGVSPVIAVVGRDGEPVRRALAGLADYFAVNPEPARGMGYSLAMGAAALPPGASALAVLPGDMPLLKPSTVALLIEAHLDNPGKIIVPVHQARRGHPVLFPMPLFLADLKAARGDRGGRDILASHPESLAEIETNDPGVLIDVDTEEELLVLREDRKLFKGKCPC